MNVLCVCVLGIILPKWIEKIKDLNEQFSREYIERPVSIWNGAQYH